MNSEEKEEKDARETKEDVEEHVLPFTPLKNDMINMMKIYDKKDVVELLVNNDYKSIPSLIQNIDTPLDEQDEEYLVDLTAVLGKELGQYVETIDDCINTLKKVKNHILEKEKEKEDKEEELDVISTIDSCIEQLESDTPNIEVVQKCISDFMMIQFKYWDESYLLYECISYLLGWIFNCDSDEDEEEERDEEEVRN